MENLNQHILYLFGGGGVVVVVRKMCWPFESVCDAAVAAVMTIMDLFCVEMEAYRGKRFDP